MQTISRFCLPRDAARALPFFVEEAAHSLGSSFAFAFSFHFACPRNLVVPQLIDAPSGFGIDFYLATESRDPVTVSRGLRTDSRQLRKLSREPDRESQTAFRIGSFPPREKDGSSGDKKPAGDNPTAPPANPKP